LQDALDKQFEIPRLDIVSGITQLNRVRNSVAGPTRDENTNWKESHFGGYISLVDAYSCAARNLLEAFPDAIPNGSLTQLISPWIYYPYNASIDHNPFKLYSILEGSLVKVENFSRPGLMYLNSACESEIGVTVAWLCACE